MYENKHTTAVSSGVGLPTVLFLIFLILKLVGVINWSWWWVTAPLWIPVILLIVVLLVTLLVLCCMRFFRKRRIRKMRKE